MDEKKRMKKIIGILKKRYDAEHGLARNKFKLLIGTILSQRTRDENSQAAAEKLFKFAKTPEDIVKMPKKKLENLIRSSGYYKEKAKKLKRTCRMLIEEYDGKIPDKREELLKFYGIGYKTADIVLSYGFGKQTIAVDTHVNRVSKRIGFADKKDGVEKVKERLEKITGEKDKIFINLGFIQFGRDICKTKPQCYRCPIVKLCDYKEKVYLR